MADPIISAGDAWKNYRPTEPSVTDPFDEFDPDLPTHWTPAAQERFLEKMRAASKPQAWYCASPGRMCDGKPHGPYGYNHARADQWPPPMGDDWENWVMISGRGAGKTRAGAEFVRTMTRYTPRITLIAATAADLRDTMIEGDSGLLRVCEAAGYLPAWEPSKRRVTFPNGALAIGFTAEEPDRLRGPQFGAGWLDEPAHYPNISYVWDMYSYGLRLGTAPRTAITTTPTPIPWLRELLEEEGTRAVRVSTFANRDNLAPKFLARMEKRYAGTRQGRQELEGEILTDIEGALWNPELLEHTRVEVAPELRRVVVGIDPAGTAARRSDLTGLVVVGIGVDDEVYVLADRSGRYSPHDWATQALSLYQAWDADAIVAEKNYGGDMVRDTLRAEVGDMVRLVEVTSRKGKLLRAEPVFSLFEQNRAHLVGKLMVDLEDELCAWVPGQGHSPDRMDAMVHAAHQLRGIDGPISISTPKGNYNTGRAPVIDLAAVRAVASTRKGA